MLERVEPIPLDERRVVGREHAVPRVARDLLDSLDDRYFQFQGVVVHDGVSDSGREPFDTNRVRCWREIDKYLACTTLRGFAIVLRANAVLDGHECQG